MNDVKPENFFSPDEITHLKSLNGLQGEAIRQRGFWEGEMNLIHQKTGKTVPIHFSVVMLKDTKNGKPLGTATIGRDMTERRETEKNLRESDMRFRSVVQSSQSSIIVADGQGKILSWNAGAEKTFGYSEQEILGQPFTVIVPVNYRERYEITEEIFEKPHGAALLGKTVEIQGLKKNGVEFPIELSLSSWGIGDKTYFGGIIRDITERKKMEELLRSNTELQQFANVASHDLQEPLRMVASYVQLLAEHLKGQLDQDALEYMGFAVDGAKRMQMLVNGLLEYSRVESRGKSPQLVDMNQIFDQTLSNLAIRITETRAKINHNALPQVMGDPVQLAQLIQNLFSNALKF
ncbi:MAG TPA: PAS domain S-box protein, partial [bacterium]|nr:PAS domain S-box protein [bacterium]